MRFGGTVTVEDAWAMGFDHVAIAVGAGLPQALPIPGGLARGMRQANDFLMALQLTGAAKRNSLANLQVRLPAVVIGGGLTGVDTATEVLAYYVVQVEKLLERYEIPGRGREVKKRLCAPADSTRNRCARSTNTWRTDARCAPNARAGRCRRGAEFVPLLQTRGGSPSPTAAR